MIRSHSQLSGKKIFRFWLPLEATWLMMAVEGPFLAAIIARAADPKFNLAAYGVAFALALIAEAPIIMMLSAANALVRDRISYLKMRRFSAFLNGSITVAMILLVIPPVFDFLARRILALPVEVERLTHWACVILVPWPAAIGYRRFFQGLLIRHGLTRRVAYGTVLRLITMTVSALLLRRFSPLSGALVGAAALSLGVCSEAAASRFMAAKVVKSVLASGGGSASDAGALLSYRYIAHFYFPLALTSMLTLGVQPLLAFFMARGRLPIESLAVLPVISALLFVFRSFGLAFQEAAIALLSERSGACRTLQRFNLGLAAGTATALTLIAFSPLAAGWFHTLSGLSWPLTRLARWPVRILALFPALEAWLCFQRAQLVYTHDTAPITAATALEVAGIVALMALLIFRFAAVGIVAAAAAMLFGRLLANFYLLGRTRKMA